MQKKNEKILDTNEENFIRCIGVDDKFHICKPDEYKTFCGIDVKRKKLSPKDYGNGRYSCYECTY